MTTQIVEVYCGDGVHGLRAGDRKVSVVVVC